MEYIYSSPSAINRHIRVKENNSWNTTFIAAVLLHINFPVYIHIHDWKNAKALK
jgi:hypothetical protein